MSALYGSGPAPRGCNPANDQRYGSHDRRLMYKSCAIFCMEIELMKSVFAVAAAAISSAHFLALPAQSAKMRFRTNPIRVVCLFPPGAQPTILRV